MELTANHLRWLKRIYDAGDAGMDTTFLPSDTMGLLRGLKARGLVVGVVTYNVTEDAKKWVGNAPR